MTEQRMLTAYRRSSSLAVFAVFAVFGVFALVGCAEPRIGDEELADSDSRSVNVNVNADNNVTPNDVTLPPPQPQPLYEAILASQISVGVGHVCALMTDGKLACWGDNLSGQIGNGTTSGRYRRPQRVMSSFTSITSISAGEKHTCVTRTSNGIVSCWGKNTYGQANPRLSNGQNPTSGCPIGDSCGTASTVNGVSGMKEVSAGYDHTCARRNSTTVTDDGVVMCWGRSDYGLLYSDTGGSPSTMPYGSIGNTQSMDTGEYFSCVVNYQGRARCWGRQPNPHPSPYSSAWVVDGFFGIGSTRIAVAVGRKHGCALATPGMGNGEVWCIGDSTSGQGGAVSSSLIIDQVRVPLGNPAIAVAAGARHSCALLDTGSIKCWGANDYGQLGIGDINDSLPPVTVDLPYDAIAIAAGGDTTCAITAGTRVYCWGKNDLGQVGNGDTASAISTPRRVTWGPDGPP